VEQVLSRCHGSLKSAAGMATCFVELRRTADDTTPEHVKLGADDCVQITLRDKTKKLLSVTGRGWHVFPYATPAKSEPIEGAALAKFRRLQRLLRAALLEPLYRFERATRQGPTVYALHLPRGETWRLELREVRSPEGEMLLLPYELSGPPGKVTFAEHRFHGVTNLPKKVELDEFGTRWIYLKLSGVTFAETVFADPTETNTPKPSIVQPEGFQADPPVGEVGLKTVAAKTALLLVDPGDWDARFRLLLKTGKELVSQGQCAADLDFLFDRGGKRYLAMPFEPAAEDEGGKVFEKQDHQRVLKIPVQRVAIVYPRNGSLASCEKAARKLLDAYVATNNLEPAGPMRIIPWVEIDKDLPTERQLNHLRIGFELPIAHR
jgi:hypothetical protein